jgi:hypothetical protein
MALDIRWRTVRDNAALIETHNAIRNAHHHLHVMLYEKNRDVAGADSRERPWLADSRRWR